MVYKIAIPKSVEKKPLLTRKDKKGTFELEVEQAVYIPSTKDIDKPISEKAFKQRIKKAEKFLSDTFGGFTEFRGVGDYTNKDGNIVQEKVGKVVAFTTREDYEKNKKKLFKQLRKWRRNWGQESIGYEVEGDLFFIEKLKRGKKV